MVMAKAWSLWGQLFLLDEIASSASLVHACRKHLEQTFGSGELDPNQHRQTGRA
jgi:hypothetical protein